MRRRQKVLVRAVVLGATVAAGCGGATRIGSTGHGGESGSGGGDTGGAGENGNAGAGGRRASDAGGAINASGGRVTAAGGSPGGAVGAGGIVSMGGRSTGGVGAGGRVFDAGSDPLRNRVAPRDACERLATIMCAAEAYCCPAPSAADECRRTRLEMCLEGGYFDEIVAHPVVGYDIDRAEAAFSEYEKRASRCDLTIKQWAIGNSGFRGVARGTVRMGGDCTPPDVALNLENIAFFGSCMDPETMACMGLSQWSCAPRVGLGGACVTDLNCTDGLHCTWGPPPNGVCVERSPNGAPCSTLWDCESLQCSSAGACVPATIENVYCAPH